MKNLEKDRNIFKVLRQCLGMSLKDMAERSHLSSVYYNELEKGIKKRPSDVTLEKIASACGIQLETLKFFVEDHQGKSLDYERCLMESLERLAKAQQIAGLNANMGQSVILEESSENDDAVKTEEFEEQNERVVSCYHSN